MAPSPIKVTLLMPGSFKVNDCFRLLGETMINLSFEFFSIIVRLDFDKLSGFVKLPDLVNLYVDCFQFHQDLNSLR